MYIHGLERRAITIEHGTGFCKTGTKKLVQIL